SVHSTARAMLDERKAAILRAVVEEYIETAQPVGSAHVAQAAQTQVSSATVRNEMAVLEREGYLVQPHTSAGRIPTDKGYRFFVDQLTGPGPEAPGPAGEERVAAAGAHIAVHVVGRTVGDLPRVPATGDAAVDALAERAVEALRGGHDEEPEHVFVGGASRMATAFEAVDTVRG